MFIKNRILSLTTLLGFLLFGCSSIWAQVQLSDYGRYDSIVVIDGSDTLKNPWAGGLNTPQFFAFDLNGDSFVDLFAFDRNNSETRTFLNTGNREKTIYRHAPQYESYFPRMWNYALIYDYNNDGKEDIFTSNSTESFSSGDFVVYQNVSTSFDSIAFKKLKWKAPADSTQYVDFLTFKYHIAGGPDWIYTNVYCEITDIPGLCDIDHDGDMDILAYGNNSNSITYYKNMSMEFFGNADSLDFRDSSYCWGRFQEDQTYFKLYLDACTGVRGGGSRHVGSSIFAHDLNGDSLTDIILGDISYPNLITAFNGGSTSYAKMTSQDTNYPSLNVPAHIDVFPAAYYVDGNNDGVKDLIVAPNSGDLFENQDQILMYKNQDRDDRVLFNYQGSDFMVGSMIDLGSEAYPAFVDINQDSLMDLVVGAYGAYMGNSKYVSHLSLYINTGNRTNPKFELNTKNYLTLSDSGLYPTFGDLDNDGDVDMLVANFLGEIRFYENVAAKPNDSCRFVLANSSFDTLNLGIGARPFFYDVNHDGKLDLLSGSESANIAYFPNIGTSNSPNFSYKNYVSNFGQIFHNNTSGLGYNTVFIEQLDSAGRRDPLGKEYVFVGRSDGYISLYSNLDTSGRNILTNLGETFTYSRFVSITGGDITGDGKVDFCYGQLTGGLSILLKDGGNIIIQPAPTDTSKDTTIGVVPTNMYEQEINVYPNPTSGLISIEISQPEGLARKPSFELRDITGKLIQQVPFASAKQQLDITNEPNGIYFLSIANEKGVHHFKIIKTRP